MVVSEGFLRQLVVRLQHRILCTRDRPYAPGREDRIPDHPACLRGAARTAPALRFLSTAPGPERLWRLAPVHTSTHRGLRRLAERPEHLALTDVAEVLVLGKSQAGEKSLLVHPLASQLDPVASGLRAGEPRRRPLGTLGPLLCPASYGRGAAAW
jgi:hypothetical protein